MTDTKKSIGKRKMPIEFVAALEFRDGDIQIDALEQLHASRSAEALAWLGRDVLGLMHTPSVISASLSVSFSAFTNEPMDALSKKPARKYFAGKNALQFVAWAGMDFGVRAPSATETALSWQEIQYGRKNGLFEECDDSQAMQSAAVAV